MTYLESDAATSNLEGRKSIRIPSKGWKLFKKRERERLPLPESAIVQTGSQKQKLKIVVACVQGNKSLDVLFHPAAIQLAQAKSMWEAKECLKSMNCKERKKMWSEKNKNEDKTASVKQAQQQKRFIRRIQSSNERRLSFHLLSQNYKEEAEGRKWISIKSSSTGQIRHFGVLINIVKKQGCILKDIGD